MDDRIADVIAKAVRDAGRYPFLFVGSGLSRRYMRAPGWENLLETVCDEVLEDPLVFMRYRAQARADIRNGKSVGELPYMATLMENDVNDALLSKEAFKDFRTTYRSALVEGASPLKLYVRDVLLRYMLAESEEGRLLSRAGKEKVAGVITTNYDTMCEQLFPSFKVYVGERDLLFSEQAFSQEIFKIHGSIEEPETMVLDSGDYREFNRKRKYLAAKLLTIFVEYPVVFLGYSLQDGNIRAILGEISECLTHERRERLCDRLIFVQHGSETQVGRHTMAFGANMLSMTQITTDDFSSIYQSLLNCQKLYDTRLIRELRGSVYRLAEKLDPTSDIVVSGVDNALNALAPGQKLVIGISVAPGRVGIPIAPEEIFEDIVLDNLHYSPSFIVENYLNRFVRQFQNVMPVFKYIKDLGSNVGKDIANYASSLTSLDSFRTNTMRRCMTNTRDRFEGSLSVKGLVEACDPEPAYRFIPFLNENELDVDELEAVLRDALGRTMPKSLERTALLKNSDFRKCVRIYDFLRYGDERKNGSPPTFTKSVDDEAQA